MKHLVLALALAIAGCATSIPPESVDLSQLVGDMVTSAKVSHVNLVNLHFDHLSNEVDRFALGEYKDAYLSNVRKLMKERNPDFVELSFSDYDSAMSRILQKRNEWLGEVEQDRRQVLEALEEHYSVLLASNAEVTSFLRSAAKVSETRAALLERLGPKVGVSGTKIKELEDKLDGSTKAVKGIMEAALKQLGD